MIPYIWGQFSHILTKNECSTNIITKFEPYTKCQGGIEVGGPPKNSGKSQENCGFWKGKLRSGLRKISVSLTMVREKGAKNYKSKQSQNPAGKNISHIWGNFNNFLKKIDV